MTGLLGSVRQHRGGLAALLRCPACSSSDLVDRTPVAEDLGWCAWLLCRACGHGWVARS